MAPPNSGQRGLDNAETGRPKRDDGTELLSIDGL